MHVMIVSKTIWLLSMILIKRHLLRMCRIFIKDKIRKFKSDIFNTQNWKYDELNDQFINDKRIGFKRYAYRNDRYGFKRDFKLYECDVYV